MSRPLVEMADIVRCAGQAFIERSRRWINWQHQKVLLAITRCRTAALGGHRDRCTGCGHTTAISYNSCRNGIARGARATRAGAGSRRANGNCCPLATSTPSSLCRGNWLRSRCRTSGSSTTCSFTSSAETLLEVARDPRHLGAEIGFFSVLHSWNQRLQFHPHVHCVLAAGGLAPDHSSWVSARRSFFLPIGVLSRVFRGKFVAGLRNAFHRGQLQFHGSLLPLAEPRAFARWLRVLFRHDWVVYSKRPFGGPEHVLRYLGAYTHRVAISNSRLVALSAGNVTFRWRDSAHGNKKRLMTLAVDEFLRRFLLHLLPPGFVRIRNFGFLANRRRATLLPLCFQLLGGSEKIICFSGITVPGPDSLTLELSRLRRNHARCRTALCSATPAPLAASTGTMYRMNFPFHILGFCPCFGAHTDLLSQLARNALHRIRCPLQAIPERDEPRFICPASRKT